jgi:hypothetical protein
MAGCVPVMAGIDLRCKRKMSLSRRRPGTLVKVDHPSPEPPGATHMGVPPGNRLAHRESMD